jgi:hypothetical protein
VEWLGNIGAGRRPAAPAAQDHIGAPGVMSEGNATFAATYRIHRQRVGTTVASAGMPVTIGLLRPMLGEVIVLVAVCAVLTVIGTALFGSPELSKRAFCLIRWAGNRAESASMSGELTRGQGAQDPANLARTRPLQDRTCLRRSRPGPVRPAEPLPAG